MRRIKGKKTRKHPSVKHRKEQDAGGPAGRNKTRDVTRVGGTDRGGGSAFQHRNLKGRKEAPPNHSDPQRKRGSGGRPGLEGRRAREAVGAGRRLVRRARRSALPGPGPSAGRSGRRSAAPGAQAPGPAGHPRSAKSAASTAAAAPGSLRPAGGAFQAGGHRGPGGGVVVSAERNRARGPTVLKKKSKNRPETAPRAALGRLPGLGAPAPLRWAARVSAAVPDAPATSRGRGSRLGSRGSAGAAARAET